MGGHVSRYQDWLSNAGGVVVDALQPVLSESEYLASSIKEELFK